MQIESPECQVAQAKINAYLSGTDLPEEAVTELEDHLAVCPDCQKVFAKHKEQFSSSQTAQSESEDGSVEAASSKTTIFDLPDDPPGAEPNYLSTAPEPSESSASVDTFSQEIEQANRILEQPEEVPAFMQPSEPVTEKQAETPKAAKAKFAFKFPKFNLPFGKKARVEDSETPTQDVEESAAPVLPSKNKKLIYLSVGLFVVLATMSFLSADPTRLFGKRASVASKHVEAESSKETKEEPTEKSEKETPKNSDVSSSSTHEETRTEDEDTEKALVTSKEQHEPDPLPLSSQREGQAASLASDELAKILADDEPNLSAEEVQENLDPKSSEAKSKETPAEAPKVRQAPSLKPAVKKKVDTSSLEAEFKKYSATVNRRSAPTKRRKSSTRPVATAKRTPVRRTSTHRVSVKRPNPKPTSTHKTPAKSSVTVYGPDGKPLK